MNLLVSFFLLFSMTGWIERPHKVKRVQLKREFTLKVGEQALIREAGLKISFQSVAEDSRCPQGVNCIWAGNGRIVVQLDKGREKEAAVQLNTYLEPKQHSFQGYDIKLVSLDPYPHKDVKIKRSDYVATIVVNRGGQAAVADER